jgi:hypothetical protein
MDRGKWLDRPPNQSLWQSRLGAFCLETVDSRRLTQKIAEGRPTSAAQIFDLDS